MSRLTVVQVVHGYPPFDQAGTEVYTRTLSRALLARPGIEAVHVFARKGDPGEPELSLEERTQDGIQVHWLNHNYRSLHRQDELHQNPKIDAIFADLLDRVSADVVHVQHLIGLSTGIVLEARRRGIPVVFTLPDFWYQCIRGQRIDWRDERCDSIDLQKCARCLGKKQVAYFVNAVRDRLKEKERSVLSRAASLPGMALGMLKRDIGVGPFVRRREHMNEVLKAASAIIGPSRFILDQYREFFDLDDQKLVHSDYGMETDWAHGLKRRERVEGELHFGFVGTFLPTKGVDLLIEAFEPIRREGVHLHLHGKAPSHLKDFEARLRRLAKNPAIHFHGPFDNRELARVLGSIDVLVVPSVRTGILARAAS
ncbi:MAG: glycosyltransferase [Planctomycetota bacterium]